MYKILYICGAYSESDRGVTRQKATADKIKAPVKRRNLPLSERFIYYCPSIHPFYVAPSDALFPP